MLQSFDLSLYCLLYFPKMIESLFFFYPKAYKYQEEYQKALEGFSKAMALDAGWMEPQEQEMRLMDYLSRLTTLQSSQVFKKKKKKISGYLFSF